MKYNWTGDDQRGGGKAGGYPTTLPTSHSGRPSFMPEGGIEAAHWNFRNEVPDLE